MEPGHSPCWCRMPAALFHPGHEVLGKACRGDRAALRRVAFRGGDEWCKRLLAAPAANA
jgi:hypothetical protein